MAAKNNIRSIRFSDDLAKLIDQQVGRTFTEKFENLVTRCVWELPAKEAELARLEERIEAKRQELQRMSGQVQSLKVTLNGLMPKVLDLGAAIDRVVEKWNA